MIENNLLENSDLDIEPDDIIESDVPTLAGGERGTTSNEDLPTLTPETIEEEMARLKLRLKAIKKEDRKKYVKRKTKDDAALLELRKNNLIRGRAHAKHNREVFKNENDDLKRQIEELKARPIPEPVPEPKPPKKTINFKSKKLLFSK